MFAKTVNSVNATPTKSAAAMSTNSINKRPAKCDTDPTIQGFAVCRR